jgi:hypothetical protein
MRKLKLEGSSESSVTQHKIWLLPCLAYVRLVRSQRTNIGRCSTKIYAPWKTPAQEALEGSAGKLKVVAE